MLYYFSSLLFKHIGVNWTLTSGIITLTVFHLFWRFRILQGKSGHKLKVRRNTMKLIYFFVEIYFVILIWFFVTRWLYFDIRDNIGGIVFPFSFTMVLIIPTNMTDNKCNMPALHQMNARTFSSSSIFKSNMRCSGETNRLIKHIEMLISHQM